MVLTSFSLPLRLADNSYYSRIAVMATSWGKNKLKDFVDCSRVSLQDFSDIFQFIFVPVHVSYTSMILRAVATYDDTFNAAFSACCNCLFFGKMHFLLLWFGARLTFERVVLCMCEPLWHCTRVLRWIIRDLYIARRFNSSALVQVLHVCLSQCRLQSLCCTRLESNKNDIFIHFPIYLPTLKVAKLQNYQKLERLRRSLRCCANFDRRNLFGARKRAKFR